MEKDYEGYKLDIWKPEQTSQYPVQLPLAVFRNVSNVLILFFLAVDEPTDSNIEQLMRGHIFTRLFYFKGSSRSAYHAICQRPPFLMKEFWQLQLSRRSDYTDMLIHMRMAGVAE